MNESDQSGGMIMAAGEGPRDWSPDDAYKFPNAPGGIQARPVSRSINPLVALVIAAGVVVVIVSVAAFAPHAATPTAGFAQQPVAVQPVAPDPAKVVYASPAAERRALLISAAYIASTLTQIAKSGRPMPTSFDSTIQGTLVAVPSGQVLGAYAYGNTIEWASDAHGRVTGLTLIGATFHTRIPLDVGAIQPGPGPGTNA